MRIVAKRRMAVWCAVLAAVFFAAGLFAFCYPLKARAEEVTPASFISAADGVTVTAGKANTGATPSDGYDVTGLTVEGGAGYEASLKGVFKEDVKLDFALLSHSIDKGSFTFKVASASNPDDYFEIHIVPSTWSRTTIYVKYKDEYRMATDQSKYYHAQTIDNLPDLAGNNGYTWVKTYLAGADSDNKDSYIRLQKDGDVLSVVAVSAQSHNEYTIARFDGLTDKGEVSQVSEVNKEVYANCCLPKLAWNNGFTISFGSNYKDEANPENDGTDICFKKITVGTTEYDLTGSEAFDTTPQWYTDYQSRATITLADEPAPYWNKDLSAYTVPDATYTTVGNSVPQKVLSVRLTKDGTEVLISGNKATFAEDGTYTLTYTAVEGSSAIGNTVSYTINVGNYFLANELIGGEGIDVASGKLNTGANEDDYDVTGLTVKGGAGYSASLKGVFNDSVKLDFALLSKDTSGNTKGKGHFTFTVASASNPDDYFEIHIVPASYNRTTIYVRYRNDYRMATDQSKYFYGESVNDLPDIEGIGNNDAYTWVKTYLAGADLDNEHSYIRLQKEGDVLSVVAVSDQSGNEYTIAKFDGETQPNANADPIGGKTTYNNCCLPKLAWNDGFTISFGSDYKDEANSENDGTDICFKKITVGTTGYDLTSSEPFDSEPQWYNDYQSLTTITLAEEPVLSWSTELGAYTVPSATYTTVSGGDQKPVESITLTKDGGAEVKIEDGKAVFPENGTYTLTYTAVEGSSAVGNTVSYTIEVGDHFLADELIDGEDVEVTRGKTNTGATEDEYDVMGLTVEGGAGYSASLKGVFNDSVKLEFALLSHSIEKGSFTFKVASASDPDDHFEICIVPSTWERTTIYVKYKDEYRMATNESKYYHAQTIGDLPDLAGNNGYTWVAIPLAGTQKDTANSYIALEWEGDVLCVKAVSAHTNSGYTIARFDGLTDKGEVSQVSEVNKEVYANCCLPKLAWNDGFTISFGSDYKDEANPENDGTDICFKKITVGSSEYDLSSLAIDAEAPDWVGAYETIVVWDVADGEETIPNREYTVRSAAYSLKDGVTTGTPFKMQYAYLGESGEGEPSWEEIADGKFTPVKAGVYEIRYTAVDGSKLNNTYSYRVTVREVQKIAHPTLTGASSVFYDGDRQYAPVAESDDYVISGRLFATKAGKYTTFVSLKDKVFTEWEDGSTDDLIYVWSIVKVTPVITADTEQSAEYDGEAQTVTASIKGVEGEEINYNVSWYADAEHEHKMESAPVDAGTYYASVWYSGSENFYAAKVVYVTFTVTKVKVTAPGAPAEVTYNGQEQTAEIAQNAVYTIAGNKQTNAGTYEIAVTLNDADNYEWSDGTSDTLTLPWTIAKATPVITAEAVQSAEYDGKTQDVTASIAGVNGEELTITVTWYSDAELKNEMEGAPVEAGTYYAVLSFAESGNYTVAESVNVTFTVTEDADDPVDPVDPSETEEPKGLSGGAIAAIVISCAVAVGAAVTVGVAIYKKKAVGTSKK